MVHNKMAVPCAKRKTDLKFNSYDVDFKLKVVEEATKSSNRETARKYGIDEKRIREWKKQVPNLKSLQSQCGGTKRRRLDGAGRKPLLGTLENELAQWITDTRASGSKVTYKMIAAKGLELHPNGEFKASRGWILNFLKRRHYKLQSKSKTFASGIQNNSVDPVSKVASFLTNLRRMRNECSVPLSMIANMDETEIWFDSPCDTMLDDQGGGREKQMLTVVLGAMADGQKLAPMIVFKGKGTVPEGTETPGVEITVSSNGWMQEDTVQFWLEKCWGYCPSDVRILIWDSYHCHIVPEVRDQVKKMKTSLCVIPGGCTKMLQPADVSWNEPFQSNFWSRYDEWVQKGVNCSTPKGVSRAPSEKLLVSWIKMAWESVSEVTIVESFRACGIALAEDGSEDGSLKFGHDEKLASDVREMVRCHREDNAVVMVEDLDFEDVGNGHDELLTVEDDYNSDEEV